MAKLNFKKIGARAAGAVGGGAAGSLLNKVLPNMNPKIRSLVKIGAGIILPEVAPKSAVIGDAGVALAGVGAFELANTMLNPGTGVQGIGEDPEYMVNGNGDEYQVNGGDDALSDNNAMSGVNDNAMGNSEEGF